MKFVYLGSDFFLSTVSRLIDDGHELVAGYSFPCDNVNHFNHQLRSLTGGLDVPFEDQPIESVDLLDCIDRGVVCFLAAGYPHKIPPIASEGVYGVNVHPSFLPKGRGLLPAPYVLTQAPEAAGVTVHLMSQRFDCGDILDQTALPLSPTETVESYCARAAIAAVQMVSDVFDDWPNRIQTSRPQDSTQATYARLPDETTRELLWTEPVHVLDAKARAFGRYGCHAEIAGQRFVVYDHDAWQDPSHGFAAGTVVFNQPRHIVVAVQGGFFMIKDGQAVQ